jgi:hypothetical protein
VQKGKVIERNAMVLSAEGEYTGTPDSKKTMNIREVPIKRI